jgi:hypothetical protein
MDRTLFALSLGLAGLTLLPQNLHAAARCAAHDLVAAELAGKYDEHPNSIGLAEDNTVMELYSSPEKGTWTITVTLPNGLSCLVAAGQNFETVQQPQVAKGDPA